ncbi:pilus assembly protein N-terminal domain-containing protein [Candidimonas humi]|uniref:Type II and III secretion system protein family protein n=1 Tax=Candidimonas humi TaxID=683355 RepID=A0ABV8NTW5_9BURK|nr:pilus assembly protein N-terminal domain-containing protein [Candidimonas humi]MBV6303273.1 pilus assembly protein N-terminal domain-containing protein [Candidimonas humi]
MAALLGGLSVCFAVPRAFAAPVETPLEMQVGEVKVLAQPQVARVAVGDGQVLNAQAVDDKEVIVFARHAGSTSLQVWDAQGQRRRYRVEVAPEGTRRVLAELRKMLERMPAVRVSTIGDKLVAEGDDLSDGDRERVAALAKRYPQLLDFTGQVGWDRMVLLDVQVVEVPRSRLQELGVRWNAASDGGVNAGMAWDGGSSRFGARPGESVFDAAFPARVAAGYFGINAVLSAQIRAMAQDGTAVVLAQPQLLARSGATAEFLAGGEVPYSTVEANGGTNTAFKPYGVSLRITPKIERSGAVRSRIEVEVSSVDQSLSVSNGPALKTRRAVTEFNVRSGQTLVLAGFLSREASRNIDKLPLLGDVPVLGELFKSTRRQRTDTELAIFVTPVVVAPDDPALMRRVERGRALLDRSFPQAPLMNTPLRTVSAHPGAPRLPPPLPAPAGGWDPRHGKGSQWSQSLPGASATAYAASVEPAPPWGPGRLGANLHDFKE